MENKYGLRLKELREERGYTQEQLAKVLKTSRSRIAMYEQGKRQPDFEMQETIADFFNVSIDYLFGRTKEEMLEHLKSNIQYQMMLSLLSDTEKEDISNLVKELVQLDSEGRARLLDAINNLLPLVSVRRPPKDTTV